jgi:ATP-binding protein involved in chromosome partitioning
VEKLSIVIHNIGWKENETMTLLTEKEVLEHLKPVLPPGMAPAVSVQEGHVMLVLEVDPAKGGQMEPLRRKAEDTIRALPGVTSVKAILTAEKNSPPPKPAIKSAQNKPPPRPVAPRVRHIIAVASGKGGVGKSTVAANLAAAFSLLGRKTGLLDADIYGASQPRMMGLRPKPETNADDMIVPPEAHGLKIMSMGFFVDPAAPVIWRGPMVHSAIQQLLRDVAWGDLDILVIDLPPGTGDAQLSLAQNVPLAGAVIVSTPQDVALSEAKKGLLMFGKVNVPALGLIENMSYHVCASCGHTEHIFDHGGVRDEAAKIGVPFLGEIPLHIDLRSAADAGTPLVFAQKDHAITKIFMETAETLWRRLQERTAPAKAASS